MVDVAKRLEILHIRSISLPEPKNRAQSRPGGRRVNCSSDEQVNLGDGVDPNMDPELAMALRISMEEEKARQ